MAQVFAIHILGMDYPDFVDGFPTIMWDENSGPVESYGEQNYTVYKYGGEVMEVAGNIGFTNRIVSFSSDLISTTNSNISGGARRVSLGFQSRIPGTGGYIGQYFDFSTFQYSFMAYSDSKGSVSGSFTQTNSKNLRVQTSASTGQRIDIFQQTWSNR